MYCIVKARKRIKPAFTNSCPYLISGEVMLSLSTQVFAAFQHAFYLFSFSKRGRQKNNTQVIADLHKTMLSLNLQASVL